MSQPALDPDRLLDLTAGMPELLTRFFALFADTYTSTKAEMLTALSTGDLDTVTKQAHTLKGASANLHALQLQETAHQIELAAKGGDAETIQSLLSQTDVQYAAFTEAADAMMASLG